MTYNLTDNQKVLAVWLERLHSADNLPEMFCVTFLPKEESVYVNERRYEGMIGQLQLDKVTPGSFNALAREKLLDVEKFPPREIKGDRALYMNLETVRVTITARLFEAVRLNFEEAGVGQKDVNGTKRPERFDTARETYHYKNVRGEGGSGIVLEVTADDGNRFALKCLKPEIVQSSKRKRFKNELWFSSKHSHKNLIEVVDQGVVTWKGQIVPFYVMPYMDATLRKLIEAGIPNEKALLIFSQILDGVEAAHKLGVVHRDLKPENILSDSGGDRVVVADFGIAEFSDEHMATHHETKAGEILGNRDYLAPEQHNRGGEIDHRADIFSLGLMLNEMFTGRVPYGSNYKTIESVSPPHGFLDALVDRMIQHSSEARFQSIEDIKKELIGRRNQLVIRQRLDELKGQVVPEGIADRVVPVEIFSLDAETGGILILKLNRPPEDGWKYSFLHVRLASQTRVPAFQPGHYQFSGDAVRVSVNNELRQTAIDLFKLYSKSATEAYQARLDLEAQRREKAEHDRIARQLEDEAQRERLLKDLSF